MKKLVTLLFSCFLVASVSAQSSDWVGCWNDTDAVGLLIMPQGGSILPHDNYRVIPSTSTTSISRAKRWCLFYCYTSRGTLYAAVTNETICTCGVTYTMYGKLQDIDSEEDCLKHQETTGNIVANLYQVRLKECPSDSNYSHFGYSCYRYYNGSNTLGWWEANEACRADGGYLASINREVENNYVLSLLTAARGTPARMGCYAWIGARNYGNGAGYQWTDGHSFRYTDWFATASTSENGCGEMICPTSPTPSHGQWTTQSDCSWAQQFICEKSEGNPTSYTPPDIDLIEFDGSVSCGDAEGLSSTSPQLEWWQTMDETSYTETAGKKTLRDSSSFERVATYVAYTSEGQLDPSAQPTFNRPTGFGFGTTRKYMIFNGLENIVSEQPFTVSSSNVISLSAWVNPSQIDQQASVIVSKALASWERTGNEAFAYALTLHNQSVYCFWLLSASVCSSPQSVNSPFVHVVGVFDGSTLQLFLNGENVAITNAGESRTVLNNTRISIVIGGQTPYDKTVNFNGMIDDVRVYSQVLSPSDIRYLYLCSVNVQAQSFSVYADDHITFVFYGHNIQNYQRVGFIVGDNASCAGAAFVAGRPPHSLWTTDDPSRGVAMFRGHSLVPQEGATSTKLTMCYTDPTNLTSYVRNIGLTLGIVNIATINGNTGELEVKTDDNGDFTGSLILKGTGLTSAQYLVFSSVPDCRHVVMSLGLYGANSEGTEVTTPVTIPYSSGRDTLFVCWAASRNTRLHGKFTGHSLRFIGPRFTSKVIAKNDGTMTVTNDDVINGKQDGQSFFHSCNDSDLGQNIFLTVEMGNYFDYLIPSKGSTLCDILTWQEDTTKQKRYWKYSYTAISPLSTEFRGLALRVPVDTEDMGSEPGFLTDGRSTLSIWGTHAGSTTGGCCYSRLGQTPSWGQAYRITITKYNASHLYFPRLSNPGVIEGQEVWMYLALFNIHSETPTGINCEWTITSDINETTVSGPCHTRYVASAPTRTVSFTIKVKILTPGYALWPSLATSEIQTVSVTPMPVPIDSVPYVPGTPIMHILRYTNPANASDMLIGGDSAVNAFYPSDAAIEPNENQSMFGSIGSRSYYWDWLATSASSLGYLGSGVSVPEDTSIVQYFAFGIYSIVSQRFPINIENVDGECLVYLDGKSVSYNNNGFQLVELRQGWHQVVIRYFASSKKSTTLKTTGGVKVTFYGSGLATNVDIPLGVPPLTVPFTPTSGPVTTMLGYTRNSISNASMNSEYLYALAQYVIPHNGFLFEEELRPDGAFHLTGNSSLDVYYYAFAIFATSAGSIQMRIDNAKGPLRIYLNHILVLSTAANIQGETKFFGAALPQGYSQVIVKAGVVNGVEWDLKVVCDTVNDAFFYTSLEMPDVTPLDAVSFRDRPLTHSLALLYLNDGSTYALPFNWSNTSDKARSDAEYSDIDVQDSPIQEELVKPYGRENVIFKWKTVSSKYGEDGLFQEETDSGAYNRYYSFAIYISRFTRFVNFTVHHFAGCTVWVNGTLNFATSSNSPQEGTPLTIVHASAGWATVLVKLQAVPSMQLVPLTSVDDANTICVQKRFEPCTIEEVCPLGTPHPSYLPFPNPTWAALSGNQWAQVGNTADVCNTTDTTPSTTETLYAACCGTSRPAYFRLSFIAASGFTAVGWATEAPRQNYPAPIINATFSAEQNAHIVTISPPPGGYNITKKVEYLYSISASWAYPNTLYTSPLTIPAEMGSVVIMAMARIGTVLESSLASYMVTVELTGTLSRSSCPTHVPCAVQMLDAQSRFSTAMAGMFVVAVDSEDSDTLASALGSSRWVRESYHSFYSSFSQLTPIDDASVFFMTLPNAGTYSLIVYPAGANNADLKGKLFPVSLNATQQQISFTSVAYAVPYFPLPVPVGLIPGDLVAVPVPMKRDDETFTEADCSRNNCLLLLQSRKTHMYVVEPPTPEGQALMYPDLSPAFAVLHNTTRTTLDCVCTAAIGGLRLPYRRRIKYVPSVAGRMILSSTVQRPPNDGNLSVIGVGPQILYNSDAFPTLAMPPADVLVLSGSFPHPKQTQAEFYCRTQDISCNAPPTLELLTDNATTTTLLYRVKPAADTIGLWALRLKDTTTDATFETQSDISSIVLPPAPTVEYAEGPCASSSASCLQNTTLTLVGKNFNLREKEGNEVLLWDRELGRPSAVVTCPIERVINATDGLGGVVCRLTWAVDVNKLPLPLVLDVELVKYALHPRYAQARFAPSAFVDTLQSLVFSQNDGQQGWGGRVGPDPGPHPTPGPTPNPNPNPITTGPSPAPGSSTTAGPNSNRDGAAANGDDSSSSSNKKAIVAVAVVCSIIIAVLAGVLIFIFVRYRLQPKKGEESEMSEVERAFVPHQEGIYDGNSGGNTYAPPPGKSRINDDEF